MLELVRQKAQEFPLGEPFSVKEIHSVGSRTAVDQALSRLTKMGELARGFYARPKTSPVLGTLSVPGAKVAQLLGLKAPSC